MSSKANTKAKKTTNPSIEEIQAAVVPVAVVSVPDPAPTKPKPKATRAKAPADPNKPKAKPLEMKYKTLLAGMLWLLDESRLRETFENTVDMDDPTYVEPDDQDLIIDAAPIFRRLLPILESDAVKRQLLATIDIKHVYKTHVSSVISEHKKAETRRRNEEKKRIKQAEIKAAKENGTHAPRAKRAPKAKIVVPVEPEPIVSPVYMAPIDFGDNDDTDQDPDPDSDSEYVDAPNDSADEGMNLDFDAEVARSMVATKPINTMATKATTKAPVSDDDDATQMLSGNESVVRIPEVPPAKKGRGRVSKTAASKASDSDEPVADKPKPAAKRGRKATMV